MRIGTSQIMNNIDKACIERLKLPMIVLMENAALKVMKNMELAIYYKYVVICGNGNNGGDGFAVARHLFIAGKSVDVFWVNSGSRLSEGCQVNYDILKNMGIKIKKISNIEDLGELRDYIKEADVTVDALFGTGLKKNVEGIFDGVIAVINENSRKIFSIDIPSGLHCDTGLPLGSSVRANKTITFEMYKRGFLNYESGKYVGTIVVESIGIPEFIRHEFHNHEFITTVDYVSNHIKKRDRYDHKGNFGRALIIAGSRGFLGAAVIASEAAVKSGAGLVTLGCSEEVQNLLSGRFIEAMTINYENNEQFLKILKNSDGVAIGPGLGNNETTLNILKKIIENANCPVVIDADGINVLENNLQVLRVSKNKVIITPHLGEMSRITGLPVDYIRENRLDVAKDFAMKNGVIVLLKGYQTVITDGIVTYINPTGNSSMASGGMGDCLTGIITSFLAQGMNPVEAAVCGAYIHGYIGDKLSLKMHSVNASHVIERLPFDIKEILQ